jgi:hypothetical protein
VFCGSCHDALLQYTGYFLSQHGYGFTNSNPHTLFCLLINTGSTEGILLGVNVLIFIGLCVVGSEESSVTALLLAQNK